MLQYFAATCRYIILHMFLGYRIMKTNNYLAFDALDVMKDVTLFEGPKFLLVEREWELRADVED